MFGHVRIPDLWILALFVFFFLPALVLIFSKKPRSLAFAFASLCIGLCVLLLLLTVVHR
jgi:uncharacterized membrane protein YjjB (DUF3815 family)